MATFASFVCLQNRVCATRGGGNVPTNVGFGYQALINNTSGYQNAAFGLQAMRNNTTGRNNTAVGYQALRNNTTGVCNTAVGYQALYNSNGSNNTAVGFRAGICTSTGASNTFVGYRAGALNTTGNSNTAIGWFALCANTSGTVNTALGGCSLRALNGGACNTGIGWDAGGNITSGNSNTIIGAYASDITTACNVITVSRGGGTSNSNGHTLWGTSGVDFNWVQCRWTNLSDCRDKTCIQDLDQRLGLAFLRKLNPVSFNWDNRESYVTQCGYEYGQKDGTLASKRKSYGFEAQQVKQVLEELNVEFEALGHDPEKEAYRITYEEMIAPLIKGIQETSTRLETLEALTA